MPAAEVRFLARLQFVLSDQVGRLLEEMPTLLRRLNTTTAAETEISQDRVRGAIRWSETFAYRAATGSRTAYVTTPTRRAFETEENQLLAFTLKAVAEFGRTTGWHRGAADGPAGEISSRAAQSTRWLQTRQLIDISPITPTPTSLSRIRARRTRRRYQTALDVFDLYQRYIARTDRNAIRDAVENRALVASRDSVLLELLCAFDLMRALRRLGWTSVAPGLLKPPVIFEGQRGATTLKLTYQHTPQSLTTGSVYRHIQAAHQFTSTGGLIPDLVLETDDGDLRRWLIIEVKGGYKRSVEESAREATKDLLAYRQAFCPALDKQSAPYGLGYAWGEGLKPSTACEISLCTPDTLPRALEALLG
ncbi:MAG: hypothetical protein ORN51_07055 [Akkermansiaceae bacterium]|nr:hypothetical protein [Akkermansiaceae bacterium]